MLTFEVRLHSGYDLLRCDVSSLVDQNHAWKKYDSSTFRVQGMTESKFGPLFIKMSPQKHFTTVTYHIYVKNVLKHILPTKLANLLIFSIGLFY